MNKRLRLAFFTFAICLLSLCKINLALASEPILWFPLDELEDVYCDCECHDNRPCGTDFAIPEGTPIYAPISGEVTHVTNDITGQGVSLEYGNYVTIETGSYKVYLGHMLEYSIEVEQDQYVNAGDFIGLSSNTGYTIPTGGGYHLHLELRYNGTPVDPELYWASDPPRKADSSASTTPSSLISTAATTDFSTYNPYNQRKKDDGTKESPNICLVTPKDSLHWWGYSGSGTPNQATYTRGVGLYTTLYTWDYYASQDVVTDNECDLYPTNTSDGAIVYDDWGGATRAYVVQAQQWKGWIEHTYGPVGNSSNNPVYCGNPITNVYGRGHKWVQDFQGCRITYRPGAAEPKVLSYPHGYAPGEFWNGNWADDSDGTPSASYAIAVKYESKGASKRFGYPTIGVTDNPNNSDYYQSFSGGRTLYYRNGVVKISKTSDYTNNTLTTASVSAEEAAVDAENLDETDFDGDGSTISDGDCDDTHFAIHPDHAEWLDGLDNDCDGAVDNDLPSLVGSTYSSQDVSSLVPVAYIDSYSDVQTYSNPFTGQVHAVFGGDDGDVYELTQINGTWSVIDLSAHIWVPYIATGTQPFGFVNEVSGMRYVVFTAETGDIWMFSVSPDNDIAVVDLSAHSWVPYATSESDPMGYADPTTGDIHVVFTGDDYYPWHIRFDGTTGGYSSSVLSAGVGIYYGTNAYPFMDPWIGDHYVLYTGSNGRVYLMGSGDGLSYGAFDVSGAAPVAYSNSTPTGLVDPITEEFYVYLLGDNERLYEVHYNLSSWASRDLSALTPVPYMEPGTTPIATVNPFTGEHLISVLGDNRRVTLFTTTDTTVNSVDLTGQASVTYTETGTAPWVMIDPVSGTTHVLFTGDNFRVQYLRYGPP